MSDKPANNNPSPPMDTRFHELHEYHGISWPKTIIVLAIILGVGFFGVKYITDNKPEARKFSPPKSSVAVEAKQFQLKDYPIKIATNGTVEATTRGNLVAQVSGEITSVSPSFTNGGHFEKGEVLLTIDERNYASAVSNSSANYSEAIAALKQEQAEAEQAIKDWQRLGFSEQPSDLVLRKPQLAAAEAKVSSARAAYEKARLDFSRTQVTAPYSGQIIRENVALGQFVSVGTTLGEIFSDQGLEVQLPLNQHQFSQLNIAEQPPVILSATFGGTQHQWQANIIRSDSIFDTTTRQINATAKIASAISNNGLELKIGQYVSANIEGRTASQALVIPNKAIREGSYVYVVEQNVLRKRDITINWQDDSNAIVDGVNTTDQIVITSLGSGVSGARARLIGEEPSNSNTTATNASPGQASGGFSFRDMTPEQREKMQKIRQELGISQGERPTPEQREKIREMMQE